MYSVPRHRCIDAACLEASDLEKENTAPRADMKIGLPSLILEYTEARYFFTTGLLGMWCCRLSGKGCGLDSLTSGFLLITNAIECL